MPRLGADPIDPRGTVWMPPCALFQNRPGRSDGVSLEVDTWCFVQMDTVDDDTVVMGILSESAGP